MHDSKNESMSDADTPSDDEDDENVGSGKYLCVPTLLTIVILLRYTDVYKEIKDTIIW